MVWMPSRIRNQLVSRIEELNDRHAFFRSQDKIQIHLNSTIIFEELYSAIRETIAREITAWHDVECDNSHLYCTCRDLIDMFAGDLDGSDLGME